jgi:UDP-glucuronate decarboxylase
VNLGNPGEFTILELAEKVIKLTRSRSRIIYKPLPQDDPLQRQPNINSPKVNSNGTEGKTWKNGLKETIKYFRKLKVDPL